MLWEVSIPSADPLKCENEAANGILSRFPKLYKVGNFINKGLHK